MTAPLLTPARRVVRLAIQQGWRVSSSQYVVPKALLALSRLSQDSTIFYDQRRLVHATGYKCDAKTVPIIYIDRDGDEKEVQAEIGKNLLDVAHDNDIELEGACGGELACATCHLVFEPEIYETLPEKEDEEDDMLDLAFELTETPRFAATFSTWSKTVPVLDAKYAYEKTSQEQKYKFPMMGFELEHSLSLLEMTYWHTKQTRYYFCGSRFSRGENFMKNTR